MNRKYNTEEERKAAKKAQDRAYYEKHKDRLIKKSKDYYEAHKTIKSIEIIEGEEWKPLVGWEDLYEVSNLGRIKSLWNGREVNGCIDEDGYRKITLTDRDRSQRTFRRARLTAQTWIPNPLNKPEVDHINTIRTDDRVCNLKWATSKENKENPHTKDNRKKVDYGFNRGKHLINGRMQ